MAYSCVAIAESTSGVHSSPSKVIFGRGVGDMADNGRESRQNACSLLPQRSSGTVWLLVLLRKLVRLWRAIVLVVAISR